MNRNNKSVGIIPEPALRRLPWYLTIIKLMKDRGEQYVSSTKIANEINESASQIAKDLSYVNISGRTKVGYEIDRLISVLEDFLGFNKMHKAFLFGAGSLGSALLRDKGLQHFGLHIIAAFDVNPEIVGTTIDGIPVYHIDEFKDKAKEEKINIGILTVPTKIAQTVCNKMIEGGIKAIWNFTPYKIIVPEKIVIQNTSLYAHLSLMFNRLNFNETKR